MSLIPFILDLADELNEINRSLVSGMEVDDFDFGMYPQDLQQASSAPRRPRAHIPQLYLLPNARSRHHPYWRRCIGEAGGGVGVGVGVAGGSKSYCKPMTAEREENNFNKDRENSVAAKSAGVAYSMVNKNGFQVSMNVKQFSPHELTVKTIDNCIVVEGKHDEKEDGHGVISRHFVRKYMLPKGFDPNDVLSTLSSDGILTVKAPPPPLPSSPLQQQSQPIVRAEEQKAERVAIQLELAGVDAQLAKDGAVAGSKREQMQQQQPIAATIATNTTSNNTQALQLMQQQQQSPQQEEEQHIEKLQNVVKERNGDANASEINAVGAAECDEQQNKEEDEKEKEKEKEMMILESAEPLLFSAAAANFVVTPAAVVANDTTVSPPPPPPTITLANDESAITNDTRMTDSIPMAEVTVPVGVVESIMLVTADVAADDGVGGGGGGGACGVVAAPIVGVVAPANVEITAAAAIAAPTAGDLVAAADAAILLAKTQCENGNNGAAVEEMAAN